jgi:hypothetical protein
MATGVERFRNAVERSLGGRPGRGTRYREDLRQEAIALARTGMSEGKSLGRLAAELGIGSVTLTRWLEKGGAGEPLRPVEVQREEEKPGHGQASSLVVVTPSGWRIEGLRLADIPELLRALG